MSALVSLNNPELVFIIILIVQVGKLMHMR